MVGFSRHGKEIAFLAPGGCKIPMELTRFLYVSGQVPSGMEKGRFIMKITDFHPFLWNSTNFHENLRFSITAPTSSQPYIILWNSNGFQSPAGAEIAKRRWNCDFHENIINGWFFMKFTKKCNFHGISRSFSFRAPPGSQNTYGICNVFVCFGAGAPRNGEKPPFSWKITNFHPFS